MGRLNRIRYWLMGVLVLVICVASPPAIAHLPPLDNPADHAVTLAPATDGLEQQAQTAYTLGQYEKAAALLEQMRGQYEAAGDFTQAAIALSNLSLTYQKLGNWPQAEQSLTQAWDTLQKASAPLAVRAQIADVQGQLHFAQGQLDQALETWQQTAGWYAQLGDTQRQALSRLHQSQALQAQGSFQQVARTLNDLATEVKTQPNSAMKATILRQLGDSLRATGNLKDAQQLLNQSLEVAQNLQRVEQFQQDELLAAINLSLGNLEQSTLKAAFEVGKYAEAIDHAEAALTYYQQVATLNDRELGIRARLNFMHLLTSPILARWDLAIAFYPTVKDLLPNLPPGRATVFAYTGLVENMLLLRQNSNLAEPSWAEMAELLKVAQAQAEELGDARSQSLVLGTLGSLYRETGQWSEARVVTQQALALAQNARADDIRYRWEAQLGSILKAQGDMTGAIAAYTQAFETLQTIRSDLLTANPDVQFSFQESVEPIYRDLVDLLLQSAPALDAVAFQKANSGGSPNPIDQARAVMESLQVAELENFFNAACLDDTGDLNQLADEDAAIVYTVLLRDRLEVILKLPNADYVHYAAPASRDEIDNLLQTYRTNLTRGANVTSEGRQLYDWLLKPAVDQGLLSTDKIKNLIFLLDGDLRLIPMATLHDGDDFVVKHYAISLVLGSEIVVPQTLPPREQIQVLAASLENPPTVAEARGYGPLPGVTQEINQIRQTDLAVRVLQNEAFTSRTLKQELSNTDYTIVHLATHGQFGGSAQNTFILDAEGLVNINELGQTFQSQRQGDNFLEMLILSACNTATGNNREVFGIAGAMVQSGARSAIATLWSVDDAASVLFAETLYAELAHPGVSRTEALRRAQVALLDRYPNRPRYWAPYVLVGSWR